MGHKLKAKIDLFNSEMLYKITSDERCRNFAELVLKEMEEKEGLLVTIQCSI